MYFFCDLQAEVRASSALSMSQSATSTPLLLILIIRTVKGYSHSFRIMCALSLLESRE